MFVRIRYLLGIFTEDERDVLRSIADASVKQDFEKIVPDPVRISNFSKLEKQTLIRLQSTGYFDIRKDFVAIEPRTRFWSKLRRRRERSRYQHAIVV